VRLSIMRLGVEGPLWGCLEVAMYVSYARYGWADGLATRTLCAASAEICGDLLQNTGTLLAAHTLGPVAAEDLALVRRGRINVIDLVVPGLLHTQDMDGIFLHLREVERALIVDQQAVLLHFQFAELALQGSGSL